MRAEDCAAPDKARRNVNRFAPLCASICLSASLSDLHTFPSPIRIFSKKHFDSRELLFILQSLSRRGDVTHALQLCLLQQGQPTNTTKESSLRTTFSGSYYAENEAAWWWNKQHTIARWLSKRKGKKCFIIVWFIEPRMWQERRAKKPTSSKQQHKPEGRWIRFVDANSPSDRAINNEFPSQLISSS